MLTKEFAKDDRVDTRLSNNIALELELESIAQSLVCSPRSFLQLG
jgi:hypothetical protein